MMMPAMTLMPGQPMPGPTMPGQLMPGQAMPGQPMFASGSMPPPGWNQPPKPRILTSPRQASPPPRPPVLAEMASGLPCRNAPASSPQTPAPRFRMQAADDAIEPGPRPLVMPSPEELGVAASSQSQPGADWAAIRPRLETMGVKSFRVDHTPAGAVSVTFLLCLQGSRVHQVEGAAATEAEAVSVALVETERYLRERR